MTTATDELRHLIDTSGLSEVKRVFLRRLVRRLTETEADVLGELIDQIAEAERRISEEHVKSLVSSIRVAMQSMTADERLSIWSQVAEGYCRYCGCEELDGRCPCWNDE